MIWANQYILRMFVIELWPISKLKKGNLKAYILPFCLASRKWFKNQFDTTIFWGGLFEKIDMTWQMMRNENNFRDNLKKKISVLLLYFEQCEGAAASKLSFDF